jgi:hypothetical protein
VNASWGAPSASAGKTVSLWDSKQKFLLLQESLESLDPAITTLAAASEEELERERDRALSASVDANGGAMSSRGELVEVRVWRNIQPGPGQSGLTMWWCDGRLVQGELRRRRRGGKRESVGDRPAACPPEIERPAVTVRQGASASIGEPSHATEVLSLTKSQSAVKNSEDELFVGRLA